MKTHFFKRGIAGLLSLVMCLSAFIGLGTTTAFAAGEQAEVYLISFPRSGDANLDYSGTWGHSNLHYMNGWYSGESKYTTIRAMHSYDGNICYCIEPGTPQDTGDRYTSKDETFWDNLPSDFNSTISPYDMKLFIGRIMQYGYTGPISTSWRSQNASDAETLAQAMATQVLIWETVVGERDEDFNHISPGSYDAVKSVVSTAHPLYSQFIGLFAAEEIVSASGTSIPADGLIEIISLNEDGTAKIKTDLPFGSYYVQELATDSHYMLSDTKYPVTFGYAGQDTAVVKIAANDGKAIENDLIYGSASGKKVDENGSALGGALIGLFRTDDGEFTKENALLTATSAEDGSFSFENIPYGTWYVREIEQPAGFVLDDTIYPVTINADCQVVEIEIVNKYVRGNIHLTKVDSEYPDNKLTGATFEVYKDSNANGKLDDSDELLGTLTEKEIGEYGMNDLFYGRYFVKETKAPEGFVLDTGVYEVMIDTDGKTYEVENKAGIGFINDAMRGNLKIIKTSSDGKVKGFAFRITGANGYDIILETNDKGEIFIDGLRIGDFTISEVSNSASSMYVIPAGKKATVKLGSTTIVEMHNVLRDTPKTGDTTNLPLLYALAGLSAAGIAVCGVIGFKKKKKEDRN